MKREAFGEIGLLPCDFYRMRYVDYIMVQAGFRNRRRYDQRLLRKAVTILLSPHIKEGKRLNEFTIWPVDGDDLIMKEDKEYRKNKSIEVSERSMEVLRRFKEMEGKN